MRVISNVEMNTNAHIAAQAEWQLAVSLETKLLLQWTIATRP